MAFKEGVALLSAYKKDAALRDFARCLRRLDWTIWASVGTKKFLDENDIESFDVADMVGPPIFGHQVVTFHPKIYASLLSRESDDDEKVLRLMGIERIDLVYVNLYPLEDELITQASNPVSIIESHSSVIEKIDIGGPSLLRAAAKGGRWVLSDPNQFKPVLKRLQGENTENQTKYLNTLAFLAETKVAKFATLSAQFYESVANGTFPEKFRE